MALRPTLLLSLVLALATACVEREVDNEDTAAPPNTTDTQEQDADSATVQQICEAVFTLCEDAWGWKSQQACEEGWLGAGADWACTDSEAYLACTGDCLEAEDCESFGDCEPPCWNDHCL